MLTLQTGLGRFLFEYQGEQQEWQYDVVTLKLAFEDLERLHNLRVPKSDQVLPPTADFLRDLSNTLATDFELPIATPTIAFKVYNVVNVQFAKIVNELDMQVTAMLKE